jgi:glycerol-3-phosphate acyltransferase PlsX
MRIAIDAMGSDNYPTPDVAGAVMAARQFDDVIILVGKEAIVNAELAKHDTDGLSIQVAHAEQIITMEDKPSKVVREKRNSSMHVGINLVKSGEVDAFVTAGNTGGVLGVAMLRNVGLGRIPGIKRPALGVIFPTRERPLLIDNGAKCRLQSGVFAAVWPDGQPVRRARAGYRKATCGLNIEWRRRREREYSYPRNDPASGCQQS